MPDCTTLVLLGRPRESDTKQPFKEISSSEVGEWLAAADLIGA